MLSIEQLIANSRVRIHSAIADVMNAHPEVTSFKIVPNGIDIDGELTEEDLQQIKKDVAIALNKTREGS